MHSCTCRYTHISRRIVYGSRRRDVSNDDAIGCLLAISNQREDTNTASDVVFRSAVDVWASKPKWERDSGSVALGGSFERRRSRAPFCEGCYTEPRICTTSRGNPLPSPPLFAGWMLSPRKIAAVGVCVAGWLAFLGMNVFPVMSSNFRLLQMETRHQTHTQEADVTESAYSHSETKLRAPRRGISRGPGGFRKVQKAQSPTRRGCGASRTDPGQPSPVQVTLGALGTCPVHSCSNPTATQIQLACQYQILFERSYC